jgi:hypothetical protein
MAALRPDDAALFFFVATIFLPEAALPPSTFQWQRRWNQLVPHRPIARLLPARSRPPWAARQLSLIG